MSKSDSRPFVVLGLLAILGVGLAVRLLGVRYGLPLAYHDDEPVVIHSALAFGTGDLRPRFFHIAPSVSYLLLAEYGVFYLVGRLAGLFGSLLDFQKLFFSDPTSFYLIARISVGILAGTATIAAVFAWGRSAAKASVGLLASLFLACNYLHVRDSHFVYHDVPLALTLTVFFWILTRFGKESGWRFGALLGFLWGLAFQIKYNGLFLGIPLGLMTLVKLRAEPPRMQELFGWGSRLAAAFLWTSFLLNPFMFLELDRFMRLVGRMPLEAPGFWYHIDVSLFSGGGILWTLLGLAGLLWGLIRRDRALGVAAAFVAAYLFILTFQSQRADRYVLPIVPALCVGAAWFVVRVGERLRGRAARALAVAALSLAAIVPSSVKVVYADRLFQKKDTRTLALDWIRGHVEPGTSIAMDALSSGYPRLRKTKAQVEEAVAEMKRASFRYASQAESVKLARLVEVSASISDGYTVFYLKETPGLRGFLSTYPDLPIDLGAVESRRIEYVILSQGLWDARFDAFRKTLENQGELVAEFSPYRKGRERLKPLEQSVLPVGALSFRELADRTSFGPTIRIYRLTHAA